MANLETLELTISANAESATQGIESLTRSLSALSKAVGRSVGGLIRLNHELKTLKGFGAIKMPGASTKTAARAIKKGASGEYDAANNNGRGYKVPSPTEESLKKDKEWMEKFRANATADYKSKQEYHAKATEWRKRQADAIKQEQTVKEEYAKISRKASEEAMKAERAAMETRGEDTKAIIEQSTQVQLLKLKYDALKMETVSLAKENKITAKQIASRGLELQNLENQIKKLENATEDVESKSAKAGEAVKESFRKIKESATETASSLGKLVSQIGRIFKTMLIRQAIRFILKAAKEGFENYYNYSKQIGGEFAKSFDSLKSKWTQFKNQFGVVLGSALKSVIPLLNMIASAAIYALNAVSALFALLSGKSTYTKAKEGMDDITESTKSATAAANDWIAAFDELNVMSQKNGGGGGSSGIDYGEMFEEVALPDWMIEWKPIIEAVVYGTLGAIILPKIFDWVQKIFGIFTGKTALKALDDMVDLFNPDKKFPDLGNAATDMVTLGGGAVAAAAALPTVRTEIEKIVTALNGVSLVSSFIGLLTELITKAVSAIPVPITLDSKNYDEWVAKHEEWISQVESKKVKITYDNDISSITRLMTWLATDEEKKIKITLENDPATIVRIMNWTNDVAIKKIKVEIENDPATVAKLQNWAVKEETKKIKVQIDDDPARVIKINNWVLANDVKNIGVEIPDISAQTTEMSLFAIAATAANIAMDGIADSITKISLVSAAISIVKQLLESIISMSADAFGDKTVNVKFVPDENYTAIKEWIEKEETKIVSVNFVYDEIKMALINSVLNAEDKTIKIQIEIINLNGMSNSTISDLLDYVTGDTEEKKIDVFGIGGVSDNGYGWWDWDVQQLWNYFTKGQPGEAEWSPIGFVNQLRDDIFSGKILSNQEPIREQINISDCLKIIGWEDLHEDVQGNFVNTMTIDKESISRLKQVGLDASYVVKMINWDKLTTQQRQDFLESIVDTFGDEGIKAIKKQIPTIKAEDIVNVVEWSKFTTDEKFAFLNSIKEAFGSSAAIKAAKDAGINIGDLVQEGMKSKDPKIKAQAQEWEQIIEDNTKPVIDPTLDSSSVPAMQTYILGSIQGLNPSVYAYSYFRAGYPQNLSEEVSDEHPTVYANAQFKSGEVTSLRNVLSSLNTTVTVGLQKSSTFGSILNSLKNTIGDAMRQAFTVKLEGELLGTIKITPAATGGLFSSGDIFMANENGNGELIGSFGNQTGVANQREIVSGIQKGVEDANREQNELLRIQNTLLRGILEKESSVRIGASSALGRTVRQSLDMYSKATGVG